MAIRGCDNHGVNVAVTNFSATARAVEEVVAQIPEGTWDGAGLGEWTLRDLVGHTSRSLVTVIDYLARPVADDVVASAAAYYTAISAGSFDAAAVTARGRQAGRELGEDPASHFSHLVEEAIGIAEETGPDLVAHTIVGGMRVEAYLPTRTFELCVHGLDIAAATGVPLNLPTPAVEEACALAAVIAAQLGLGPSLLLATTGRRRLPRDSASSDPNGSHPEQGIRCPPADFGLATPLAGLPCERAGNPSTLRSSRSPRPLSARTSRTKSRFSAEE